MTGKTAYREKPRFNWAAFLLVIVGLPLLGAGAFGLGMLLFHIADEYGFWVSAAIVYGPMAVGGAVLVGFTTASPSTPPED